MSKEFPYPEIVIRPGGSDWWDTEAAQLVIYDYFDAPVNANISVSGVSSQALIGTVTLAAYSAHTTDGIFAFGVVGNTSAQGSSEKSILGVYATGITGNTTQVVAYSTVVVIGVSGTALLGNVTATVVGPVRANPKRELVIQPPMFIVSIQPSIRSLSVQERQDTIKAT